MTLCSNLKWTSYVEISFILVTQGVSYGAIPLKRHSFSRLSEYELIGHFMTQSISEPDQLLQTLKSSSLMDINGGKFFGFLRSLII